MPQGRAFTRAVARLASDLHVRLYWRTKGRRGGKVQGVPVLLLTTNGRKTGLPRTRPLGYSRDGHGFVVTGSNGGSDAAPAWWLNLHSNPTAHIEVGTEKLTVTAAEATGEESARFEPVPRLRIFTTGSSRIPSDPTRRTQPVWQYQAVPALSALLPTQPGVPRVRLRSAPPGCCDSPARRSRTSFGSQRLTAHRRLAAHLSCRRPRAQGAELRVTRALAPCNSGSGSP
jgi:deazaflavin-dependent oxidoreductase (nitroreductase family)